MSIKNKKITTVALWLGIALFFFALFTELTDPVTALLRTTGIVVPQAAIFYLNIRVLLPKYFKPRPGHYVFLALLSIVVSFGVGRLLFTFTPEYRRFGEVFDGPTKVMIQEVMSYSLWRFEETLIHSAPPIFAVLASLYFYSYKKAQESDKKRLSVVESEKDFLMQQINPHFLFNTLNNIYSMTSMNDPKGPEAVMRLSKLLDYSLYGTRKGIVSLRDEVSYIKNFTELFLLKDDEIVNVTIDHIHTDPSRKIAPMLLIPFVENAFKHGNVECVHEGFVRISLATEGNTLTFICENSFCEDKRKSPGHGIGIQNVSRRLELFYPKRHSLETGSRNRVFYVKLKIELDDTEMSDN
ncbi:histidine kinase (plasmid) [Fulvitalea axinellae]|uniref:Histidine kinase n=1 Tax=Fulvitalea axinellae TaxID=1182444 RepID=A0AAU9CQG1_9BACT|nr:histidine kinase [Fulvitalea axinellae]